MECLYSPEVRHAKEESDGFLVKDGLSGYEAPNTRKDKKVTAGVLGATATHQAKKEQSHFY